MKETKSVKLNAQQHENVHFSPFKFAKLFDPEASWDKVILLLLLLLLLLLILLTLFESFTFNYNK